MLHHGELDTNKVKVGELVFQRGVHIECTHELLALTLSGNRPSTVCNFGAPRRYRTDS